MNSPVRRCLAEGIGTALLLATVVGSGIMGERLAAGNAAIALLANSVATGCMLYVLILLCGAPSGAHFNPLVTVLARFDRALSTRLTVGYLAAQLVGAVLGVLLAHTMFGLARWMPSVKARTGSGQWVAEAVATFGLILVVRVIAPRGIHAAAASVAAYITAAYWFTASTSFANPTVTIARALTDTFSGIRSTDVPAFIAAECGGALLGYFASELFVEQRPPGRRPRD